MIEKRKPLSEKAERHGWIGCNILLENIPSSGKISIIMNGKEIPKRNVLDNWKRVQFIKKEEALIKGWLLDIMLCIDKLETKTFTLDDIYEFERFLQVKHPENKHIKDKIRQQLQVLRDKRYLRFSGRGKYSIN